MMDRLHIKMTTTVERAKLLETLKANREEHAQIVQEAREGYVDRAAKVLERRLAQLREGHAVSLHFDLYPPLDHTTAYDTTIKMLEWTTEETVTLGADEFRHLVEDEWEWTDSFLERNAVYSQTAMGKLK